MMSHRIIAVRVILFIFVIVYAVVGHRLFAESAPDHYATFSLSLYTVRPAPPQMIIIMIMIMIMIIRKRRRRRRRRRRNINNIKIY